MQYLTLDHDLPLRCTPLLQRPPVLAVPPPPAPTGPARTPTPRNPERPPRPALLAGEDLDAPDQHIFRGTD
ncbi:hypothetical protein [Streptomyces sp. NPDC058671]|uniref:hypothetical protein n=1 Tax=Streptomyces sp. NPDC058671 TaxID=3346590 RepID=UPI003647E393